MIKLAQILHEKNILFQIQNYAHTAETIIEFVGEMRTNCTKDEMWGKHD
jgi:hypothetical protein